MPQAPLDADIAGSAIKVAQAFEQAKLPYAIGGAIALTMHGFVRATRDVDRAYVRRMIATLMGDDDERVQAWDAIVTRFTPSP